MSAEKTTGLQIKGIKEGLLISFGEEEWPELLSSLIVQIEENTAFFQGGKIVMDVGNRVLHAAEMGSLRDNLSERGVTLWAVISNSPATEETARIFGLATRLSSLKEDRQIRTPDKVNPLGGENAICIQKTLRSGAIVSFNGSVVIIGDVNPGAEINAAGSVVVWGRLKGLVHAGSGGDDRAIICALTMEPAQMRIANLNAISNIRKGKPQPEKARIQDGSIIIEQWNLTSP